MDQYFGVVYFKTITFIYLISLIFITVFPAVAATSFTIKVTAILNLQLRLLIRPKDLNVFLKKRCLIFHHNIFVSKRFLAFQVCKNVFLSCFQFFLALFWLLSNVIWEKMAVLHFCNTHVLLICLFNFYSFIFITSEYLLMLSLNLVFSRFAGWKCQWVL